MQTIQLPNFNRRVSRLCFGTLTISPLQRGFSLASGAALLKYAAERGVNFFDTAELYETYEPLCELLKSYPESVIATKCYAYDALGALASYEKAARELGRDYIDIFMLHEQESEHTLRGHEEALVQFHKLKDAGHIGLVGLSTHHVAAVRAAVKHPLIEIVHPLINIKGIGIADGSLEDMLHAIHDVAAAYKAVFAMKPLGGGHLYADAENALRFMWEQKHIHAVAQGFQSPEELDFSLCVLEGQTPPPSLYEVVKQKPRQLMVHDWCEACGRCVSACKSGALQIADGRACVNREKCVLCGYCAKHCPNFCLKVV